MDKIKHNLSSLQKSIIDWIRIDGDGVDQLIGKVSYKGQSDKDSLINPLKVLVDENPILRCVIREKNGEYFLQEENDITVLNDFLVFDNETEVDRYAESLQQSGINNSQRMCYFVAYTTRETYGYIMQISHLISDGWSMMLIVKNIDHILHNEAHQKFNNYYDVIEKDKNHEALVKNDVKFWCDRLAGVSSSYLDWGNRANHKSATIVRKIPANELGRIKRYCEEEKITAPQIFLTALGILISKMSIDFDSNTYIDFVLFNRRGAIDKNTLGLYMKPFPVKINTDGAASLREAVKTTQQEIFCVYAHSNCLYEDVLKQQRITNPNIRPLGDVSFNYLIEGAGDESHNEIIWYPAKTQRKTLEVEVTEWGQDGSADVAYHFDTGVFNETDANLIHERLIRIIDAVMDFPETSIGDLDVLTESEGKILRELNDNYSPYQKELTISELFEKKVSDYFTKTAVVFENESISYGELNSRVNRVALKIRESGVKRGEFVCLFMEKSIEMVIGILAVIKAGACYVPINPDYPSQRKKFILEDCKAKMILTYCEDELVPDFDGKRIDLKTFEFESGPVDNPEIVNESSDYCYMIYTSGTTGTPKGVIIRHFSLNNLVNSYRRIYEITSEDYVLQSAEYVFDQSVQDIFLTLLNGATLVIATREKQLSREELRDYVNSNKVTVLCMTPMAIAMLEPNDFRYVRLLETGGGEAQPNVLKKWVEKGVRVFNTYGPTEYTVNTTSYEYKGENVLNIPIGHAIDNTKLYIIRQKCLCGINVPGELCISGDSISVGYLNNKVLTEKAFVQNPFDGTIMYRTGDLCRILEDGNVEYLGRIDEQVKIRGFRIELGEIDSVLRQIDFINDCAVVAKKDKRGEDAICAYFISDREIEINTIREILSKKLPRYMLPSYYMQIESLPRTVNGKLDKKSLPIIGNQVQSEYIAPETETQTIIAEIFEKILEKDKVGNNDDFFDFGGHSLRAVSLINEIEYRLRVRIKIGVIFEYTTPKLLGDYIDANKENLLIKGVEDRIPSVGKRDYYPMSSSQKRMYLAWLMDKQSMAYNMSVIYNIEGHANEDRLRETFIRLVEAYPEFRTCYFTEKDEFFQKIEEKLDFEIEVSDSEEGFFRPFDLNSAPLIRARYVNNAGKEKLLIDMHHSISDGASVTLMMRDFATLYNGGSIDDEKIRFVDYSVYMEGKDLSSQKKYWTDMYIEEAPVFDMPTDFPRPKFHSAKGSSEFLLIPKSMVRTICKNHQMTDYMVLMAGIMILMSKYGRCDDVVVGTPINARMNKDSENILGMFVNTLAVRGYPAPEKKIDDFLKEVKNTCMKIYENQEYPFDELLDDINALRDPARNPLFDVMFVLQNNENAFDTPEDILKLNEITLYREHSGRRGAKVDMTFEVIEQEDAFEVELEYCTDLYTSDSAKRILTHFEAVIEDMSASHSEYIREIVLSTENERQMILSKFGSEKMEESCNDNLVSLLWTQIEKNPKYKAISSDDYSVTYAQLLWLINAKISELKEQGIGKGDVVAIIGERCINMIVCVYATLSLGAAYVMIDKNMPQERKEYIIEDTSAKCVLEVSGEDEIKPVSDNNEQSLEKYSNVVNPDSDAYIIYTSGTSGKPKGVVCKHRGIVNLINWLNNKYPMKEKGKLLEKTNLTFVDSTYEMFWPISCGCELVIFKQGEEMFMDRLADKISSCSITNIILVPTVLNELLIQNDAKEKLDSLRTIVLSGEPLKTSIIRKAREVLNPLCVLINQYGQTEGGFSSTYYEIRMNRDDKYIDLLSVVPAGKSIEAVRHFIVDNGHLCGIGVPGEICVSAKGLSKGYVNNPELDHLKYTSCDFAEGRLLHTGDLGRWLPDGNIICMGRMDDQIKIRGQRIELGEIDSIIRQQDYIDDCAVVALNLQEDSDEKSIVAYIVSKFDCTDRIRETLTNDLPRFMLPSAIVTLKKLPFTRNGKLDIKSLPIPAIDMNEYAEPQNDTQRAVCEAYEEVLGVKRVGIKDDFFMLGGHSLKAAYLCNALGSKFMVMLAIKDIFDFPTPEKLAERILSLPQNKELFAPIPKAADKPYYEMTFAQKEFYIANAKSPDSLAFLMSFTILTGELDEKRLQKAFQKVVDNHSCFRICFPVVDGKAYQKLENKVDFVLETADEDDGDFHKPFSLDTAPLMRARYIRGEKLYIDFHHIILDGASTSPFFKELFEIYEGSDYPVEKVSYIDYSEWIAKKDLSDEKAYWLKVYKDEAPILDIPTDFSRNGSRSYEGKTIVSHVEKARVGEYAKKNGYTDYSVLISAFMIMLSKYSNMDDIVVGTPVSGRIHKDIEKIPGVFINTIALRGFPKADMKIEDFLKNMQETCLHSFAAQSYPFECLVKDLNISHSSDRSPLFDVMMILQNNEDEFKSDMTVISNRSGSKMDMILEIVDDGEYKLNFEYCSDLFTEASAEGMLDSFKRILLQITDGFSGTISEIDLLNPDHTSRILEFSCAGKVSFDKKESIISVLQEYVNKTPKKIALSYNGEIVTYSELWNISREIAKCLLLNGIVKGEVVALVGRRGLIMPECMYGCLMAGAAFSTVDDQFPQDRIMEIISEINARFVLSEGILYEYYGMANQKELGNVYELNTAEQEDNIVFPEVNSEDLAYVHFTSGTDGKPKGVKVPHYGSVIISKMTRDRFLDASEFRVLQTGNYSFVLGLYTIFTTHMIGGSVFILPQNMEKDTQEIINRIKENKIEVILMTPTMMERMVDSALVNGSMGDLSSVKYLLPGGEPLKIACAEKLLSNLPQSVHLINQYGQTESSTIVSASNEVTMRDVENGFIPIGRPVKGINMYIAQGSRLCDIGIPGEICIGGNGITYGYLDEELNRTKFRTIKIPDQDKEEKVYCTGDLALWNPNGTIKGLGRRDGQIKINGQRVEVGDVISAIRKLPDVEDCSVIATKDLSDHMRLCAYIVMPENLFDINRIKNILLQKLPSYMVPSAYNRIDFIPMTRNGKLDKKSLPAPNFSISREYVAPSNEMEKLICDAFSKVLVLNRVGVKDNFYDIGGDSLKSIDLVLEITKTNNQRTNKQIGVVDILRLQTPELIAAFLLDDDINDICCIEEIQRPEENLASEDVLNRILKERKILTKNYSEIAPSISNMIFLKFNSDNNVILKLKVLKDVSLDKLLRDFGNVVYESGFEYSYSPKTNRYHCHAGRRKDITVLDISEKVADSLVWQLHDVHYEFNEQSLISDVFAISEVQSKYHCLYICIHHSQFDRFSSGLLERRLNCALLNKPFDETNQITESSVDSNEKSVPEKELWHCVETIDKIMENTDYDRLVMTEIMTEDDYKQPILKVLKMYSENNELLRLAGSFPFILVVSGRNSTNCNMLGCFIEYRFYIYDIAENIILKISDMSMNESVISRLENIPLLNYIGVFKDNRTKEDVFTVRKGFERAKYLHASVFEGKMVLKAPVYYKK